MSDAKIYKLAPMAKVFATMTVIYFIMTLSLLAGIPFGPGGRIAGWLLFAVALLVWFWFKPAAFIVDSEGVMIRWLLRTRQIKKSDISAIERLNTTDLGWMIRIGAGGLWGAFGMFKTSREGMIDGYFSTNEDLVLLRLKGSRPLLLSPENPAAFIKALGK